jgi:sugar phosphate isomerase/epimerase
MQRCCRSFFRFLTPLLFIAYSTSFAPAQVETAHRTGGMLLGVQAWSFSRFTTMEAIEKAAAAGAKNIELYPGQPLGGDFPGVTIGPDMGQAATDALRSQLKKYGVNVVAYGVVGIDKNEAGARKLFAWAKSLGIGTLNTESADAIETMDKMVKEFDINVGFHDHPKTSNPSYRMWDPNYVYQLVKNHDKRIGSCADTGHWVRSGIKPVDALHILHGRVVGCHLKDLNVFSPDGHDVPAGTGVSDVKAILDELHREGYRGPVSIEYEFNMDASLPEVAQCIGFVAGYCAGRGY